MLSKIIKKDKMKRPFNNHWLQKNEFFHIFYLDVGKMNLLIALLRIEKI